MIGNSVCAILFLGTPHQGSPTANYGKILGQIVNTFVVGSGISRYSGSIRADLLSSLRTSEDGLLRIAEDFRIHTTGIKVFSFIEQKSIRGLNQRVRILACTRIAGPLLLRGLRLLLTLSLFVLQSQCSSVYADSSFTSR